MKLTAKIAVAASLVLGLIAAPAGANVQTDKVDTKVVIEGFNFSMSTGMVVFKGHVKCSTTCLGGRKITLKQTDEMITAGTDKTNADGDWKISFNGADVPPGNFKAKAAQRTVVKKRHGKVVKKTVCKAGVSETFIAGRFH